MAQTALVVLFQDPAFLVVEKPCGVHTAPLHPGGPGTLLDQVIAAFPEVGGLPGVKAVEPGLVHRIDRDTSGLVVVARSAAAFAALRRQLTEGGAAKGYLAACACPGAPPPDGPLCTESRFAPLGAGRRRVRVVPREAARRMPRDTTRGTYVTEARCIARGPGRALFSVRISRGFRHQVRAHLSSLGYPILGDPLYGVPVPEGFSHRMYLHAARIEMTHPLTGAPIVVESPAPAEFAALFPDMPPGAAGKGEAP